MAWDFDGTTDYWQNTSFSGPAASKKGTLGLWFNADVVNASQALLAVQPSASATTSFSVAINANAGLTVVGRNNGGSVVLSAVTANDVVTAGQWYWLGVSFDLENSLVKIYLNNTSVAPASPTVVDDTVDWADPVWTVGGTDDGSGSPTSLLNGKIEELVLWTGQYLDISTDLGRDALVDHRRTPLTPVGYSKASRDFDQDPELYLAGAWLTNLGTGSNLTKNGTPSSANSPNQDRHSAQRFAGEKWGTCDMCGWDFPESELKIDPATQRRLCITGPHDYPEKTSRGERRLRGLEFI